jgi:predicted outer membrane protein
MGSKLKGFLMGVASGALVLTTLPVVAQQRPTGPDQELVGQLHQLGQDEIATALLGEARAVSPRVEAFAATVAREHRVQNGKLMDYAERKNMDISIIQRPGDALAHGVLARAPLANSPREAFDYNFVSQAVAHHQAAIDVATAAQRLARDPELRGLIGGLLVAMSDRLVSAQALLAQIPAPQPSVVPLPAYPPGVSRTQTGADLPPPEATRPVAPWTGPQ